jgi:hypothetical protein
VDATEIIIPPLGIEAVFTSYDVDAALPINSIEELPTFSLIV